MKTLAILLFVCTLSVGAHCQLIDSTVSLNFNGRKIECQKRYIAYTTGDIYGNDTLFYTPPQFFLYLVKGEESYIRTAVHKEYGYEEDFETGELSIGNSWQTDSVISGKYLGQASADSLLNMLTNEFTMIDTKETYSINKDFTVHLSSKNEYVTISAGRNNWTKILSYEISKLSSGDYLFIDDINFNCQEQKWPCYLTRLNWKIQ